MKILEFFGVLRWTDC